MRFIFLLFFLVFVQLCVAEENKNEEITGSIEIVELAKDAKQNRLSEAEDLKKALKKIPVQKVKVNTEDLNDIKSLRKTLSQSDNLQSAQEFDDKYQKYKNVNSGSALKVLSGTHIKSEDDEVEIADVIDEPQPIQKVKEAGVAEKVENAEVAEEVETAVVAEEVENAEVEEITRIADVVEANDNIQEYPTASPPTNSTQIKAPPKQVDITTNIIDSYIFLELSNITNMNNSEMREKYDDPAIMWHTSIPQKSNSFRDILEITSVEEQLNFGLGENVVKWKTFKRKSHKKHVLVGMTENSIVLVGERNGEYVMFQEIELELPPKTMEIYMDWDTNTDSAIGVVVVSIENKLIWYELRGNFDEMNLIWEWNIHKNTLFMRYFTFKSTDVLMIVTEATETSKTTTAELYEFSWEKKDFWILQIIPLETVCRNVAIIDSGNDFIIGIPQNDIAMIYKYNETFLHNRNFVNFLNITSQNLTSLSGFKIGGHSYLAVGGLNSQILRYYKGEFYPQTILSQTFGIVEYWLPIPARTYRDDLILLVQHRIVYAAHSLTVLEALIWNGEAFNTVLQVQCRAGNAFINYGLTCMLDIERPEGIFGAAVIQHGRNLSLIVPRLDAPSSIFQVNFQIVSAPDPVLEEMKRIRKLYDTLDDLLKLQNSIIEEAEVLLRNGINAESDLVVLRDCEIERITASSVQQDATTTWRDSSINLGNQAWTIHDSEIDVNILLQQTEKDSAKLDEFTNYIRNYSSSTVYHIGNYTMNGDVNIINLPTHSAAPSNIEKRHVDSQIFKVKTLKVKTLTANELHFETINDVPADELVFKSEDRVVLEGEVEIESPLYVVNLFLPERGTINSIDFAHDIVPLSKKSKINLKFDEIVALNHFDVPLMQEPDPNSTKNNTIRKESITIDGNIMIEKINGLDFNELIQQIVMTNIPNSLDELVLEGNVFVESEGVVLNNLNNLVYPSDYLLKSGPAESIVTGRKNFTQILYTSEIDTTGEIDGVNIFNLITLDSFQEIPMETTFNHLEVSENLEVIGNITGSHLEDFLENPSLLKTRLIKSACIFNKLIVNGSIIISNKFDGYDVDGLLADVVYRSQESVNINSFKNFDEVNFAAGVTILSNYLNRNELVNFVTKSTEQHLNMTDFFGNLYFDKLEINGLVDNINITELEYSTIKRFGDQFTESELYFSNGVESGLADIDINNLQIMNTLNSEDVHDYIDISENFEISSNVQFLEILAENVWLREVNLDSVRVVNDINLQEFEDARFSLTKEQTIETPFIIPTIKINGNLKVNFLNNVESSNLSSTLNKFIDIKSSILAGEHPIENCYVDGNLFVNNVNEHNLEDIIENVIWLDRPNEITDDLKFMDLVTFENLMVENLVNNENCNDFLNNIVYKVNGSVEISGKKIFTTTNLVVYGDIETEVLNNNLIENIVTKTKTSVMDNNVLLIGSIAVDSLTVKGDCNSVKMESLERFYQYDSATNTHIVNGSITFNNNNNIAVTNLTLSSGYLNDVENISNYLSSIPKKSDNIQLRDEIVFSGKVYFNENVEIENYNNLHLPTELNNIVKIDEPTTITGDIVFSNEVRAGIVEVSNNFVSSNTNGCDFDEWFAHGLLIDRDISIPEPLHFPRGTFQAQQMLVNIMNGRPISDIVTLHTDQIFNCSLVSDVMYMSPPHAIYVYGQVNGVDLRYQRENTLMTYGNQHIKSPIVVQNARVLKSMSIRGAINGTEFNSKELVKLYDPDISIQSPIFIEAAEIDQLWTEDSISNIDFNSWYASSLWKAGKGEQTINSPIKINSLNMQNNIEGNDIINGVHINEISAKIDQQKLKTHKLLEEYSTTFLQLCSKVQQQLNSTQNFSYFFKYFEFHSSINVENGEIVSSHLFSTHSNTYLLINNGCFSHIHQWNMTTNSFVKLFESETGLVGQWITLSNGNLDTYLVSQSVARHDSNCHHNGLNVWKVDPLNGISHINQIDTSSDVIAIRGHSIKFDNFYILLSENKVKQFDIHLNVIEEWQLSPSYGRYNFLSSQLNLGLALNDGKKIVILNSVSGSVVSRKRRDADNSTTTEDTTTQKPNFSQQLRELNTIMKTKMDDARNLRNKVAAPKVVGSTLHKTGPIVKPLGSILETTTEKKDLFQSIMNVVVKVTKNAEIIQSSLDKHLNDEKIENQESYELDNLEGVETDTGYNGEEEQGYLEEPMSPARKIATSLEKIGGVIDNFIDNATGNSRTPLIGGNRITALGPQNSQNELGKTVLSISDGLADIAIEAFKIKQAIDTVTTPKAERATRESNFPEDSVMATQPINTEVESSTSTPATTLLAENLSNSASTVPATATELESSIYQTILADEETSNFPASTTVSYLSELRIARPFPNSGVIVTENDVLPEVGVGEVLSLEVGELYNKKYLVAVSSTSKSTVPGNHDVIRIYNDVLNGELFQTLPCHRPSSLTTMNIHDDTLLIIAENGINVKIFIYRGISGFIQTTQFKLSSPALNIFALELPAPVAYKCPQKYIGIASKSDIQIFEAQITGNCGLNLNLNCDSL